MKIYDCFTFFNELDLLEIRLEELGNFVDYFVLVEATKTHSGKKKPLYFEENKKRFEKWKDKIIHIIVEDMPEVGKFYFGNWKLESLLKGGRWKGETFQRMQIARGLKNLSEEDIVMISDLDEIPNPKRFSEMIKKLEKANIVQFRQRLYYYFLNGFVSNDWVGTRACKFKTFRKGFGFSPERVRRVRHIWERVLMFFGKKQYIIENGGWHFSYLGGAEKIAEKLSSFAHAEFDKEEYKNQAYIKKSIEEGVNILHTKEKINYVKIDKTFPKTILQNKNKYAFMIK